MLCPTPSAEAKCFYLEFMPCAPIKSASFSFSRELVRGKAEKCGKGSEFLPLNRRAGACCEMGRVTEEGPA